MFEIENHSHTALRDPQIIQHQPTLVIRDSVDDFRVYHNGIECDQVGDKQADLLFFVEHIERRLLPERDLPQSKLYDQRILIGLFNQAVSESVENLDCTTDDLKDLIFVQKFVVIGVHSC